MSPGGSRTGRPRGIRLPVTTGRLTLREFVRDDESEVVGWSSDERVTRHMPLAPRGPAAARRHLVDLMRQQSDPARGSWELAVTLTADGRVIGGCELSLTSASVAEIGYVLARRHWGQGYATELACTLVRLAFEDLGVTRVDSTVAVGNTRSMQVLEKAGLRWEALRRRHARAQGRWWDAHLYAVTREDWRLANPRALATTDTLRPSSSGDG